MLTVRSDRLGFVAGDRVLDLGCGAGRHAFEAMRNGAAVVAIDADAAEVKDTAALMTALAETDERHPGQRRLGVGHGRRRRVACLLPTTPSTGSSPPKSSSTCPPIDWSSPSCRGCFGRAGRSRSPCPAGFLNWCAGPCRTTTTWFPAATCASTGGPILASRLAAAGFEVYASHFAHALHSPYWWLKCAVGVGDDRHPLVRAYHRVLVWDITAASPFTRVPERLLNPVLGKSLVLYARKPVT